MGRPRLKGERLPNLSVVAEDSSTAWRSITVADWYGKAERTLETISATAVWYSTGLPAVPIRWVLVRDPHLHRCARLRHATRVVSSLPQGAPVLVVPVSGLAP